MAWPWNLCWESFKVIKMAPTYYWSAVVSILHHVRDIWRWNIGWLSLKVIENGTVRKLFAFHSNDAIPCLLACIICEIKRDIDRKSRFFFMPLHSTRPHTVWCGKTRMAWLPDGDNSLIICFLVRLQTEYGRVTDRKTDG